MNHIAIWLVKLYQKIPGPWHGYCRHIPSCSAYAITAFTEYGFLRGLGLSFRRILRCNPFGTSGYDPVPVKKEKKK